MIYKITSRQYRPQALGELLGQSHIVKALENAILRKQIAQAYLFSGIRGIGKTSVARIFSKSLNCAIGMTIAPCQTCVSCEEITKSISNNVLEIDGASNRGIEEIKKIKENIQYLPNQNCLYRIYIIDEVHMLTDQAFNALLKTLEEPPSYVIFIFATTESHKVKLTIRSRCQHYFFRPITRNIIEEHLRNIASKQSISIDQKTLSIISSKSNGSMRDAQNYFDQVFIYGGQNIEFQKVKEILGNLSDEFIFNFLKAFFNKDIKSLLSMINQLFLDGEDLYQFVSMLIQSFKQLLLIKNIQFDSEELELFDFSFLDKESISLLFKYKDYFDSEILFKILKLLFELHENLKKNFDQLLLLESFIFQILSLNSFYTIDFLLDKIKYLESKIFQLIRDNKIDIDKKVDFSPKFDFSKFLIFLLKKKSKLYSIVLKLVGLKFSNQYVSFFFYKNEYDFLKENIDFLSLVKVFLQSDIKITIKEYNQK